jgi:hypothetical protein
VVARNFFSKARTRRPDDAETRQNRRVAAIKRRIRQYGPKWQEAQISLLETQIERLQAKLAVFRETVE